MWSFCRFAPICLNVLMTTEYSPFAKALRLTAAFCSLLLTSFCESGLWLLVAAFYHPHIVTPDYAAVFVVPADHFRPEPVERMQYVLTLLTLPFLLYGWYALARKILARRGEKLARDAARAGWISLGVFFVWLALLSYYCPYAFNNNLFLDVSDKLTSIMCMAFGTGYFKSAFPSAVCWLAVLGAVAWLLDRHPDLWTSRKTEFVVWAGIICAAVSCCLLEPFGPPMLDNGSLYGMHFEAVFHPVAEVYAGKSLLVDLINQYGLYPYYLNFIFKIIGLGVFKFTIMMVVLSLLSYVAFFDVCYTMFKNRVVALLALGGIFFCVQMHFFLYSLTQYFQGMPLRTVGVAIATALALRYLHKGTAQAYYASAVGCAFSVMWNFDTGFVVFLTWLLTLAYKEIVARGWFNSLRATAKHIAINAGVLAAFVICFALHTKLHSGAWPDFGGFFAYIGYFYGFGFNLLPMVPFHPWNIIALLYAGGLLYSAVRLYEMEYDVKALDVFFLAIMGCGIFAYYQGRSVTSNLVFVAWPALLIGALPVEYMLEHAKESRFNKVAAALGGALLCSFIISDFRTPDKAWRCFNDSVIHPLSYVGARVPVNIDFMRGHTRPGESVIVLSYHAAVYNTYTQTKNPFKVPGLAELYLTKEIDEMAAVVASEKYPVFIETGVFCNHTAYTRKVLDALEAHYDIAAESSNGMAYCLPKKH